MKVHVIHAGTFKLDGGAMFGVVPKSIWQKINPSDERNLCTWAMRLLLVETEGRRILIDTGMGSKQDDRFFSHYEPEGSTVERALSTAGFSTGDITDVLLTHLHFDHCGGAVTRKDGELQLTFENAIYWSNNAHWKWATVPNARERASFLSENILPIAESKKLQFIEPPLKDGTASFDGTAHVKIHFVHGHTESMMIPELELDGRSVFFCADLLPSAGHIPVPYVMSYDTKPLITIEEKTAFLTRAANNKSILFLEHDLHKECCTVSMTDKGVRLEKSGTLLDFITGTI